MGLFGSKKKTGSFDRSAAQVREALQPIIDEIEVLQEGIDRVTDHIEVLRGFATNRVDLSNKSLIEDLIRLCADYLTKAYEIESLMTEMADDLMIQMSTRQISPAAANASMKSIQFLDEGLRECKAQLKISFLDLGVTTAEAKKIVKTSWEAARASTPIGILKIEKLRNGKEEWDWITDETWRDSKLD